LFEGVTFIVVFDVTQLPESVEECTPEQNEVETSFRRYSIYTVAAQLFYVGYLSFMFIGQQINAYYLICATILMFLVGNLDILERMQYWKSHGYELHKPSLVWVFMFTSGCAFFALIVGAIILTNFN
jgi:hypothetical protein